MNFKRQPKAIFVVWCCSWLAACTSSPPRVGISENPVQDYEIQKRKAVEDGHSDYSLDRKRFEAAMSLYSQAQTDLKSGASGKAIAKLALAREYNPWHDDIKDLYLLSVRHFVRMTKDISQNVDCDPLADRLNFLNEVAPDSLNQFKDEMKRCDFRPKKRELEITADEIATIKVPENASGKTGSIDYEIIGELQNIVKRNRYVPIPELLTLSLEYLSKVRINVSNLQISPIADDAEKFELLLAVEFENESGMSGKEYCEETRKYLEMKESSVDLKCPYWGSWFGSGELTYAANPIYRKAIWENLWPLPRRVVVAFKFKYKNKPERILKDVIVTRFDPANVDYRSGFAFNFESGDLPLKQKEEHIIPAKDAIVTIEASKDLVDGLMGISAYIDLSATKKLYH